MWHLIQNTHTQKQAHRYKEEIGGCQRQECVGGGGKEVGEMGKGGLKVQTARYTINKSWGNVQHNCS